MKDKFKALFDEKLWKFLLVGVLNTLVGNGLMFLLYNLVHWGYWPSTAVSYSLASVMSYFLAYGVAQKLMEVILSGVGESLRDNIAMLTGMCLFVGLNYLGQRFFAFREPKE